MFKFLIYTLLFTSCKIHFKMPPHPFILGIWHQDLPSALWIFRKTNMTIFLSQSRDAHLFSKLISKLGYGMVRGSSTRGSTQIKEMLRLAHMNKNLGMALDGPKGPAKIAKPGTEWLVKKSNLPSLRTKFYYSRFWELNTWDRMIIPMPFSKITVEYTLESDALN